LLDLSNAGTSLPELRSLLRRQIELERLLEEVARRERGLSALRRECDGHAACQSLHDRSIAVRQV